MGKKARSVVEESKRWGEKLGETRPGQFETASGIKLPPLNLPNPERQTDDGYLDSVGFPGEYPFTRGVQRTMYRGKLWTMRQYAGFGTAEETNSRYHYLLSRGTTGLSVAFDLPTQMGRDSDDPRARGEVGRVGVAIDSIEDMDRLFSGIPLAEVSVSMTINATANVLLALHLALARRRNIPWTALRGTVQNDILKEYIARGTHIYPPGPAIKLVTDVFQFCRLHVPEWNTISISGYHIREAGSDAVQELAFSFGDAIAYVEAALARGLQIDDFAPRLAFFFNCHNNFIEEVAKFRAARRIWAKLVKERFGAKSPRSMLLRFHTQTAGSTLTAQQPQTNVVRTTLQALAAVFGGTQSLHTNSYDEALGLPTEESALLALRTQQVIAHESGVADIVDPLGGSYAVEQLTDEIETRVAGYLKQIDGLGGMVKAIEAGFPQRSIEEAAYRYQREIEAKTRIIVGMNEFTDDGAAETPLQRVDPEFERTQVERLKALKNRRDNTEVRALLETLEQVSAAGENVMPVLVDAVDKHVTLGEICDVFRKQFGEYH